MWEKSGGWPARFSDILVFLNSHFFNVVNPESRFDMDWSRLYILQSPYTCFIGVDYAFYCSTVFPRFSAWKKSIHHTYKPIRSWTVDILPYNTENHISPKRTTWDRGQFLKIETVPCYLCADGWDLTRALTLVIGLCWSSALDHLTTKSGQDELTINGWLLVAASSS